MTVLHLADEGEAADLAAFLSRLLHYDRGAAVRLQAAGTALAVFGRPPSFEVLAIRAARLAKPYEHGLDGTLDVTVSAGELLESIDESGGHGRRAGRGDRAAVGRGASPARRLAAGAGAARAGRAAGDGLRGGRRIPLPHRGVGARGAVRGPSSTRSGGRSGPGRSATRALPVRAVHAAQSLGFLRRHGRPATRGGVTGTASRRARG